MVGQRVMRTSTSTPPSTSRISSRRGYTAGDRPASTIAAASALGRASSIPSPRPPPAGGAAAPPPPSSSPSAVAAPRTSGGGGGRGGREGRPPPPPTRR